MLVRVLAIAIVIVLVVGLGLGFGLGLAACKRESTTSAASTSTSTSTSASTSTSTSTSASPAPEPEPLGLPEDWAKKPKQPGSGYVGDNDGPGVKAENGTVFEVARIALAEGVKRIVLPEGALLESDAEKGVLFVATKKVLRYRGAVATTMPLEGVRANMGCATRTEGDALVIGTFGEWNAPDGFAQTRMLVKAPAGLGVVRRGDLSGPASVAGKGKGPVLGTWFGASAPTPGWERVTLEVDPRHLAR